MSCYGSTGFVLTILTFVNCVIAFVVPHWLVSWGQKLSTFDMIGLWEICFTAFTDDQLQEYKYFSGCWWTYHPELDLIQDMIHPAWFKAVQAFATLALMSSGCALFPLVYRACVRPENRTSLPTVVSVIFNVSTAVCGLLCVIIFGACAKDPFMYRLPMAQYNYFGAGYAFIILCTLSAIYSVPFLVGSMSSQSTNKKQQY